MMTWTDPAIGFGVGILLGTTGVGGGAVMTPLLVLTGRAQPVVAVGTDLVWALATKLFGTFFYSRRETIDSGIVKKMAMGSIPGCLVGIAALHFVRAHLTAAALNARVLQAVGAALIVVAINIAARALLGSRPRPGSLQRLEEKHRLLLTVAGSALVGFLVVLTSVGSGSLIMAMLMILYSETPMRRMVGSDLMHSVLLVSVASFGQWGMRSVDLPLLGSLLLGSLPGIWLGTRLSFTLPEKVLRPALASLLFVAGWKFL
jgi:uncharacterized protein